MITDWETNFRDLQTNDFGNLGKNIFFSVGHGCVGNGNLGVFQRPLTLILLQKYHDTNGRRIVIQIGGVYTTFCQEEGILLQKYRDRNGRCIAILFKSIGVRARSDSPD